jgi:hypothetical protein
MRRRLTTFVAFLLLCGCFLSHADVVPSGQSRRSVAQEERLCGFLSAQLNRSIESFEEDFGPITSKSLSAIKLPSQINRYGRFTKAEFAQRLSLSYLEIDNKNDQIIEIATSGENNLQKLGLKIHDTRDVMALYGQPDISEPSSIRYECDSHFEEFSAAKPNSVSIRIGSHAD